MFGTSVYRTMRNIKGYIEHIVQESEWVGRELPYSTRTYIEKRVMPEIGLQSKEMFDLIPVGWRPKVPTVDRPIRLQNDNVETLECIPMFQGKDVIVVRLSTIFASDPKKHGDPVEYFTMDGGFADSLTFDPKQDARALGLACMRFTRSVANKMQRDQKTRNLFGV
jgi:hypothetical protein